MRAMMPAQWSTMERASFSTSSAKVENPRPSAPRRALSMRVAMPSMGVFLEVDAAPILALAHEQQISFEQAEESVLGINHAELGAILLEHWSIPEAIVKVVRYRLRPDDCPEPDRALDLVHVGDVITKMTGIGMMQRRMLKNVPKADVVITNPTHLACALGYDPLKSPAPVLLAKGADYLAEKIKEIARENRIPIRENRPLAQALYKSVEVGESIPEDLYQAVAAILAQLDKFKRGKRPR